MPSIDSSAGRQREAESFVADLMRSSGWNVDAVDKELHGGADLVLERNGHRFAVEVKALAEGRVDRALPLLSMAILQAKAHARDVAGAKPLAILLVGNASPNLATHLRSFAKEYAEGVAIGVVSKSGFRHFIGRPFDELNAEQRAPRQWSGSIRASNVVNLFSDLNQWMLKILLAEEVPESLLSAPRVNCRSGAELAAAAGASAMSASRFLQQLRSEGYLDQSSEGLRLVRRKELFDRWRAASIRSAPEMPMRLILRGSVHEQLRDLIGKHAGEACLGLFAAAGELKFGHVSGVPPYLYVRKLPHADDRQWRGLLPALAGDAPDLILRQAAFPVSMFKGAVRRDGLLVSDVIQTWLDVSGHAARGAEQADLIYDKFLHRIIEGGAH